MQTSSVKGWTRMQLLNWSVIEFPSSANNLPTGFAVIVERDKDNRVSLLIKCQCGFNPPSLL